MEKNDDIKKKVLEEEDYIRFPKMMNSLAKFLLKNSEGVKDSTIARLLMMTEKEVEELYGEAIKLLKKDMEE